MGSYKISNRYALALLNISLEKDALEQVTGDIDLLSKTISDSGELQLLLKSPVVKTEKKLKIFEEIFKGKVSEILEKFLYLVIKKGRERFLPDIISEFYNLRDERLGIVNVEVKSAVEFSNEQIDKLLRQMEDITKKKVRLSFRIEKNILGGFVVKVEDTILDASIKRQLEILHQKFLFGSVELN